MSKSREQLIEFIEKIDVDGKTVLDVGAGPKDKWAINYFSGIPKEYKTADFEKTFGCDYVVDLNETIRFPKRFDYVMCFETLEHVWDAFTALENLIEHAKEKIFISIPFINPIHDTWDYLRYTDEWFYKAFAYFKIYNVKIVPRVATIGLPFLKEFYRVEGMRISRIRLDKREGHKLAHIGYFVEVTK